MDLQNLFKKRIQQIQKLENFVVLYGKKRENLSGLCQISNEVEQTKDILVSCVNILDKFRKENNQKFTKLSKLTKHQQTIMLDVLNKLLDYEHQPQHEEELTIISENIGTPTSCKIQPFKSSLAEYIKSPYAMKRMRPLALQFTDFEKTISAEEFKIIPGYMRGRECLEDIQQFLETVIIRCFTLKYALLPKRREAIIQTEVDLWNLYKSQEEYFKGFKFITQGDICRLTDKQIDKKTTSRITILRHLKIIREERKNAAICYIWFKN